MHLLDTTCLEKDYPIVIDVPAFDLKDHMQASVLLQNVLYFKKSKHMRLRLALGISMGALMALLWFYPLFFSSLASGQKDGYAMGLMAMLIYFILFVFVNFYQMQRRNRIVLQNTTILKPAKIRLGKKGYIVERDGFANMVHIDAIIMRRRSKSGAYCLGFESYSVFTLPGHIIDNHPQAAQIRQYLGFV